MTGTVRAALACAVLGLGARSAGADDLRFPGLPEAPWTLGPAEPAPSRAPPPRDADAPAAAEPPAERAAPDESQAERRAPEQNASEGARPQPGPGAQTTAGQHGAPAGPAISGGTISGSTISGATISGSEISGATISGATISGGTISGATISGGEIRGGTISSGTPPAAPRPREDPGARRGPPPGDATAGAGARPDPSAPGGAGTDRRGTAGAGGGDDDEDVAARALQRSLVQRGALLLPEWGAEVVPGITYGHTGQDGFTTLPPTPTSPAATVASRRRTHQLTGSVTTRLGLPWDLQLDAMLPVQRTWADLDLGGAVRSDASGAGLGDPRITLSRQLLRAQGKVPDLLLGATWKPRVGSSPFDVAPGKVGLGSGYTSIGGTLTASKTADPLVFLLSASYTANLPAGTDGGRRDAGDTWGLGAGAVLAVSPETSMSFLLDLDYKPEDRLDGARILGTDQTIAILQIGFAMVLSRRALLNLALGIGLTPDSPSVQLGFSIPLRLTRR